MMKSMKTLMISAVVCGAMALPLSGVATPDGDRAKELGLTKKQIAAAHIIRDYTCMKRTSAGKTLLSAREEAATCTLMGKLLGIRDVAYDR